MPTTHIIPVLPADEYTQKTYGIRYESALVYRVKNAPGEKRPARRVHNPEYPHRVKVWDNTIRPNADPEAPGSMGHGKIGPGKYVSPKRKGTDAEQDVYLTAESVALSPNRSRPETGDIRSGQQYAEDAVLTVGDFVILHSPEGLSEVYVIRVEPSADPVLVPVSSLIAE
jgi:hypothetical protein